MDVDVVDVLLLFADLLCAPKFAVAGRCHNTRGAAVSEGTGSQRVAGNCLAHASTGKTSLVKPTWPDQV